MHSKGAKQVGKAAQEVKTGASQPSRRGWGYAARTGIRKHQGLSPRSLRGNGCIATAVGSERARLACTAPADSGLSGP